MSCCYLALIIVLGLDAGALSGCQAHSQEETSLADLPDPPHHNHYHQQHTTSRSCLPVKVVVGGGGGLWATHTTTTNYGTYSIGGVPNDLNVTARGACITISRTWTMRQSTRPRSGNSTRLLTRVRGDEKYLFERALQMPSV